ncbi:unnamed protein product [Euphydryas editha]|uniref:HTH psq-type domain-containing protein n=1 Tax=Euphydryas editha TaxID=104508 RepID=A0AAU9UVT0_EUPED|nr:unnamed protein product [Euphydryas editha]
MIFLVEKKKTQAECPPDICIDETPTDLSTTVPITSEENDTTENEGRMSSESSPLRQRRAGILKGGRLWKSLDNDKDTCEQNDDQRSTTASDEDGSVTPRSVRFVEKPKECEDEVINKNDTEQLQSPDSEQSCHVVSNVAHKLETPLILTISAPKANSAVQQLFNSSRPPPPAIEPQLVTSETLRAWDAGVRPKTEEAAVRRVAERNALRCSLLRSEARKKQQPKVLITSILLLKEISSPKGKVKIIESLKNGESCSKLAQTYGVGASTISDIKKTSDSILKFTVMLEN